MIPMIDVTEQELATLLQEFLPLPRAKELAKALYRPKDESQLGASSKPANFDQMSPVQQRIYETFVADGRMLMLYGDMAVTPWLGDFTKFINRPEGRKEILFLTANNETKPHAEVAVVICALRRAFLEADTSWVISVISEHPIYRRFLQETLDMLPWLLNEP